MFNQSKTALLLGQFDPNKTGDMTKIELNMPGTNFQNTRSDLKSGLGSTIIGNSAAGP